MNDDGRKHVRPLIKRGGTLTLAIPQEMLKSLGWNRYENIILEIVDGHIILSKVKLPSVTNLRSRARSNNDAE